MMPNLGLTWAVLTVAVGSGFQHGFNTGVMHSPELVIQSWIKRSLNYPHYTTVKFYWTILISIFCIGGMIGGALIDIMSNKFGRKGSLMLNNILVFIAAACMFSSKYLNTIYLLIIGRFIIGINAGLNAGLAPIYLNEISSINQRGAIGTTYQLLITVGLLFSQVLGFMYWLGTEDLWPYLLGTIVIPAIFQVIAFLCAPESPKFLLSRDENDEKAMNAIKKITKESESNNRFTEIKNDIEDSKNQPAVTLKQLFTTRRLRRPLTITCGVMIAQQISGDIKIGYFFFKEIFVAGFLTFETIKYSSVGANLTNVVITLLSFFLIDKIGRKPLLVFAFIGMIITTSCLCVSLRYLEDDEVAYISISVVYLYVIFFATGVGGIPWLLGPELFNTTSRPLAMSIAVPINWFFNYIVTVYFLPLQMEHGAVVFIVFPIFQALSLLFILLLLPETKNRPIEEIVASFE